MNVKEDNLIYKTVLLKWRIRWLLENHAQIGGNKKI